MQNSAFLRYPLHGRFLQDPISLVQRSSEVQHPAPSASFPREQSVVSSYQKPTDVLWRAELITVLITGLKAVLSYSRRHDAVPVDDSISSKCTGLRECLSESRFLPFESL
ncbi:hypothetical protein TNCV_493801 [Trichonephila clavipes]|nr:hypothetical protein TNCV_493801 [Trichonephila clavipes]